MLGWSYRALQGYRLAMSLQESKKLPSTGRQGSKRLLSKGRQGSKRLLSKGRQGSNSSPFQSLREIKSLRSKGRQESKSLLSQGHQERAVSILGPYNPNPFNGNLAYAKHPPSTSEIKHSKVAKVPSLETNGTNSLDKNFGLDPSSSDNQSLITR
uniref:Uncharacterized protein n=1 Tax=Timema monikensis TaxID=170555 RepID=A0A7R9EAC6_9NEOP|nr:unnamed protein product [Timema monikensis]